MHGRLDLSDLPPIIGAYRDLPLVSISASQRAPLPWADWAATVYNGIDLGRDAPDEGEVRALLFPELVGMV